MLGEQNDNQVALESMDLLQYCSSEIEFESALDEQLFNSKID
jgi:hypothetical protein